MGVIPGMNETISYLILAAVVLLLLGCCILGIAYFADRKSKKKKFEQNGVMMAANSPSGDGNLTLPSWDRPKQPSVMFECADDEARLKKKKRKSKKKSVVKADK